MVHRIGNRVHNPSNSLPSFSSCTSSLQPHSHVHSGSSLAASSFPPSNSKEMEAQHLTAEVQHLTVQNKGCADSDLSEKHSKVMTKQLIKEWQRKAEGRRVVTKQTENGILKEYQRKEEGWEKGRESRLIPCTE